MELFQNAIESKFVYKKHHAKLQILHHKYKEIWGALFFGYGDMIFKVELYSRNASQNKR